MAFTFDGRDSPVDNAKTTPLKMSGAAGDTRSRELHAGSSDSLPASSTSLNATTLPLVTGPLPAVDKIAVQIGDEVTDSVVTPSYPVIQYGHVPDGGDAIGSGFVYTGKAVPALIGKYIFSDLSTGHVWYSDYKDMIAADDGDPKTLATMHEVKIQYKGQVYDSMFPITRDAYQARGGKDPDLPGRGTVSGAGRADARFAVDAQGELFIYSKTDGMIRRVTGAATPSQRTQK